MENEVWILGGAGRSGRVIAAELVTRGLAPTLVGRNPSRLSEAASHASPTARTLVAASIEDMAKALQHDRPAVVINTVGPFATTAEPIARACLAAGAHYVDLANDVAAVTTVLALDDQAQKAGRTLVTGAGFGVTATESVVVKLFHDQTPACETSADNTPARVRVDMVPSLAAEAGPLGDALAGSLLDGLPGVPGGGRYQSRCYTRGRLAPARLAGDVAHLTLPDGSEVTTAGMPLGELIAAQRASGAPDVISASSEAPSAPVVRAVLPLVTALLQLTPVREFAKKRLAHMELKAHDRPREHSYGHAVVTWADGRTAEGWLRLGDAQAFTGAVPAEVAHRLLHGDGDGDGSVRPSPARPGAFTPAALFGPSLAESCGADYLTTDTSAARA